MKDKESKSRTRDINQANNSDVSVIQKNIIILYFNSSDELIPNLKPLETILGEKLNIQINERGEVILNTDQMEIKELDDGCKAFVLEKEEIKTGNKEE